MSFPSPVAVLDSIMDAQGLDLFDTPMDYEVTYEGDYYQDPSIPASRRHIPQFARKTGGPVIGKAHSIS